MSQETEPGWNVNGNVSPPVPWIAEMGPKTKSLCLPGLSESGPERNTKLATATVAMDKTSAQHVLFICMRIYSTLII